MLNNNVGWYQELPLWRKHFKWVWRKGEKTPITLPLNEKYCPGPFKWVCTCPQFHRHHCLLCKHLIQSLYPVNPVFFLEVKWRCTAPFWSHSTLIPLDSTPQIITHSTTPLHGDNNNGCDSRSESDDDDDGSVNMGENINSHAMYQDVTQSVTLYQNSDPHAPITQAHSKIFHCISCPSTNLSFRFRNSTFQPCLTLPVLCPYLATLTEAS